MGAASIGSSSSNDPNAFGCLSVGVGVVDAEGFALPARENETFMVMCKETVVVVLRSRGYATLDRVPT